MCVEVSNEWPSGSEQECNDNSLREAEREIKTHITGLPTKPPVQGYDPSTFYYTAETYICINSAWVSTVGFFCGSRSLEGISQLLGGGI